MWVRKEWSGFSRVQKNVNITAEEQIFLPLCRTASDLHPLEQRVWAAVQSGGGEQAEGQHPQAEQGGARGEGGEREGKEGRRKRCRPFKSNIYFISNA